MTELRRDRIDLHEIRHGLKLVTDAGDRTLFENRADFDCPACHRPFSRLLATEQKYSTFDPDTPTTFCVVHEPDRLLVFTHEK